MASFSRRDFFRTGLAGSFLASFGWRASGAEASPGGPGRARNVIFMVSDGMSLGTLTLAERFRRRFEGRGTHWLGLYARPDLRRALVDTTSADSLVTDSAAAASAWGCGVKMNNGAINVAPDGRPRTPVLVLAKDTGRATGLVTTARITHATPAGFAAQVDSRNEEGVIARQYLQRGIDVLLGGGARFFDADLLTGQGNLVGDFAGAGYRVVRDRDGLSALAAAPRILGLFGDDHLPYTLDAGADSAVAARTPTLAEMTRAALHSLEARGRGFVVQIEGARVDHAAHGNDLGALVHDQLAFDDAIGEAVRFAGGRDDTLVIVTTDHGNANPGLNGAGGNSDGRGMSYGDTQKCFERLAGFKRSNAWILEKLSDRSTAAEVRDRVHEANGVVLGDDEIHLLQCALRQDPSPREGYRVRNAALITLGQLISNYTSVGWTGTQHTGDLVELAAFGPGSEAVGGLMQNTDVFGVMTRAIGIPAASA